MQRVIKDTMEQTVTQCVCIHLMDWAVSQLVTVLKNNVIMPTDAHDIRKV